MVVDGLVGADHAARTAVDAELGVDDVEQLAIAGDGVGGAALHASGAAGAVLGDDVGHGSGRSSSGSSFLEPALATVKASTVCCRHDHRACPPRPRHDRGAGAGRAVLAGFPGPPLGVGPGFFGLCGAGHPGRAPALARDVRKVFWHGPEGARGVALTFDDGPHPRHTRSVLDVLDQAGAKATFFVIGEKGERHPDILREIVARGHLLGVHGARHDRALAFRSLAQVRADLARATEALTTATGQKPRLYRPPVGQTNPRITRAAEELDLTLVGWSVRARDGIKSDPESVVATRGAASPRRGHRPAPRCGRARRSRSRRARRATRAFWKRCANAATGGAGGRMDRREGRVGAVKADGMLSMTEHQHPGVDVVAGARSYVRVQES